MDERVKRYIAEALRRHHNVDDIIAKLASAGHNEENVRTMVKSAVQERLRELEQAQTDLAPRRAFGEVLISFLIRGAIGVVAAWSLYQVIIAA